MYKNFISIYIYICVCIYILYVINMTDTRSRKSVYSDELIFKIKTALSQNIIVNDSNHIKKHRRLQKGSMGYKNTE